MIRIEEDDLHPRIEEMVARAEAGEIVIVTRGGLAVMRFEPVPVTGRDAP